MEMGNGELHHLLSDVFLCFACSTYMHVYLVSIDVHVSMAASTPHKKELTLTKLATPKCTLYIYLKVHVNMGGGTP